MPSAAADKVDRLLASLAVGQEDHGADRSRRSPIAVPGFPVSGNPVRIKSLMAADAAGSTAHVVEGRHPAVRIRRSSRTAHAPAPRTSRCCELDYNRQPTSSCRAAQPVKRLQRRQGSIGRDRRRVHGGVQPRRTSARVTLSGWHCAETLGKRFRSKDAGSPGHASSLCASRRDRRDIGRRPHGDSKRTAGWLSQPQGSPPMPTAPRTFLPPALRALIWSQSGD